MRHLTWRGERHVYRLDDKPVEPVIVTIKSAVSVGLSFDPWKQRSAVVGNRFDGCSLPVSGSAEPLRRCDSAVTLGLRTPLYPCCTFWKAGSSWSPLFGLSRGRTAPSHLER